MAAAVTAAWLDALDSDNAADRWRHAAIAGRIGNLIGARATVDVDEVTFDLGGIDVTRNVAGLRDRAFINALAASALNLQRFAEDYGPEIADAAAGHP